MFKTRKLPHGPRTNDEWGVGNGIRPFSLTAHQAQMDAMEQRFNSRCAKNRKNVKIMLVAFVIFAIVAVIFNATHYNNFTSDCVNNGGKTQWDYSASSEDGYMLTCRNADGAITGIW